MSKTPFNLQDALAGDPVITRDGRKVLQIAQFPEAKTFKLVAFIEGNTAVTLYMADGRYNVVDINSPLDLFMAPKTFRIGDIDVPLPETVIPFYGQKCYIVSLNSEECCSLNVWRGYDWQVMALKRGLVHLNRNYASIHGRALLDTYTFNQP